MPQKPKPRKIELLAPAKDASIAIDAINYGADAVYMGASRFGARALATNAISDMALVADYAHRFNAKLYATVNTIIYDDELREAERLIHDLYHAGVDALIVQDMGILRMDIPPIALHSSTQCDLRTPEKAKFLQSLGFSQLVMARELTLKEIEAIHNATTTPLEAFVYGALCVSYSGRCQISQVLKGRSANRGECAQVCRMSYDLVDENSNVIIANRHMLSLKDLNQSNRLLDMIEAGVSSFKIEGRLKDANYVRNSVAYFRQELDKIISQNSDKYVRSSTGLSTVEFTPSLDKCFNRSFTHYFLEQRNPGDGTSMASTITPKSQGELIGEVVWANRRKVKISTKAHISNGDGLSFYNGEEFTGFRANRVENDVIFTATDVNIPPHTMVYRTYDKMHDDEINRSKTQRKIGVDFVLRTIGNTVVLDATDTRGNYVTTTLQADNLQEAKTSQRERQKEALSKLGGSIYMMNNCEILTNAFIPASLLGEIKRNVLQLLDRVQRINHKQELRGNEDPQSVCYTTSLASADNVANVLARELYENHGVTSIEPAIELSVNAPKGNEAVMHTRYCIRRELGACRHGENANKLPNNIFLRNGKTLLKVECDCNNCEMKLKIVKK